MNQSQESDSEQQYVNCNDADEFFSNIPQKCWEFRKVRVPNMMPGGKDIQVRKWVKVNENPLYDTKQIKSKINYQASLSKQQQQLQKLLQGNQANQTEVSQLLQKMSQIKKQQSIIKPKIKKQTTHKFYICHVSTCKKTFSDNSKLRRHQLVHSGVKSFKCHLCSKAFSLDFNLRAHIRTHTGEKPYTCKHPNCNRRFSQSSHLMAHQKNHQNEDYQNNDVSDSDEMIDEIDEDEEIIDEEQQGQYKLEDQLNLDQQEQEDNQQDEEQIQQGDQGDQRVDEEIFQGQQGQQRQNGEE